MDYFEKSICELSREPDKALLLLKAIEQQRFTDGREAEAEKHRWISGVIEKKFRTCLVRIYSLWNNFQRFV